MVIFSSAPHRRPQPNGIASSRQHADSRLFFGLKMDHVPAIFLHRMMAVGPGVEYFFRPGAAVSILFDCYGGLFLSEVRPKIPGAILVTFGAAAAVLFLCLCPSKPSARALSGNPQLPAEIRPLFAFSLRRLSAASFSSFPPWRCLAPSSPHVRGRFRPYDNDNHNPKRGINWPGHRE